MKQSEQQRKSAHMRRTALPIGIAELNEKNFRLESFFAVRKRDRRRVLTHIRRHTTGCGGWASLVFVDVDITKARCGCIWFLLISNHQSFGMRSLDPKLNLLFSWLVLLLEFAVFDSISTPENIRKDIVWCCARFAIYSCTMSLRIACSVLIVPCGT